jgi:hypothetical protein
LRNESRFWTIDVDLKTHNEFFKTEHNVNELLNHLIERDEKDFSRHIREEFRSMKKILFFFDRLDEVEKSCVDIVLNSIKTLSSEKFYVWISSRKNLKTNLENCLGIVVMDIEEFLVEQQKLYIKNRLQEKEYKDEQIVNVISKIFNKSAIDNTFKVLSNALNLCIITQYILGNGVRPYVVIWPNIHLISQKCMI